jgi:hypothetical protein
LDGMRFPIRATKVVRTWIAHKSRNYSMISYQLNFKGKDGVLLWPLEMLKLHIFCMNFMVGFRRPLCEMNHSKNNFASWLLFAHAFQGCPWLF